MNKKYIPKEISWLSFNERVLQEAENKEVPLLERFKFLGIYSNNLDEYFRVRVATLKRLSLFGNNSKEILGYNPKATLKKIQEIVLAHNEKFEKIYTGLLHELAKHNTYIINEKQLDVDQAECVRQYFHKEVRTRLMPFLIEKDTSLPNLTDDAIYFAIYLSKADSQKRRYALLEIPSNVLPRFILLPKKEESNYIIFLDDVIRFGLKEIFFIFDFDEISAYTIKLTKDAELEIADDISESYIDKLSKSLQQRKKGTPVRFIYDRTIPKDLLNIITKKLNFGPDDVTIPSNRYHNFKDFMSFPNPGRKKLFNDALGTIPHRDIQTGRSILSAIKKKEIMLFFPYHPFDYFIDLLRESSIDPYVTSIQITLYRLARNSSVINALLNAVRNGKSVTTVVELQARFDEEANILWGKVYTDLLLLTTDKKITNEVFKAFNFFSVNYKKDNFYHLVLSPFFLRNKIILLIENEIRNARAGKKAYIYLKINNITDVEIIDYLYKASQTGVKIRLIVRGMLSLVPGVKKLSEKIEAIGIVDRYLEHSRFLIFCDGGNDQTYISSADLMTRNLDHRIEVTCPVYDKNIKSEIKKIFDIQWGDNVKARIFDADQSNKFVKPGKNEINQSQVEVYKWLRKVNEKTG
jgi:polyphosphate kinase